MCIGRMVIRFQCNHKIECHVTFPTAVLGFMQDFEFERKYVGGAGGQIKLSSPYEKCYEGEGGGGGGGGKLIHKQFLIDLKSNTGNFLFQYLIAAPDR